MSGEEESQASHPRGRCFCGAWLPPGDKKEGIECNNCYEQHHPESLRMNGFEWTGEEWVHDG